MKKHILILALFILISSCKKEETVIYSSNLVGQWEWLSTCGGFSGICGTPQTSHVTIRLVFSQDSIYYLYQNDTLVDSRIFSIVRKPADYYFGSLLIDSRYYNYLILHDTLSFSPEGADFGSTYKRKK
jgi:hypothetical protein